MGNRACHLFEQAEKRGDKTAIIFEGQRITFATLAQEVLRHAGGLSRLGIGLGSHVGIMIPSSPDFIIIQQALYALGAVVSPLNVFYRPKEVAHVINSCDLEYVITLSDLLERMPTNEGSELPTLKSVISVDGPASATGFVTALQDAISSSTPLTTLADVAPGDVVTLLNTSATTGKSKGVMLTAANLAANYDRTPEWMGLSEETVTLCALPLYNTFGLNQCINAMLVTGGTLVLLPRFDAKRCIDAIKKYQCTFIPAVPTMLQKIIDFPNACSGFLSSINCIMTGGAPVPAALLRRVIAATAEGAVIYTGYGLTEGTALATLTPVILGSDGEIERGKSIGKILDGMSLAIKDEDGGFAEAGAIGEIVLSGPNLMLGYYNAEKDTAEALVDGWLNTGDLGYIDKDGYVFIVDRKKDIIIRGGQNIYPADIEEILYHVDGVAEAAVIGLNDELLGEIPIAFVALQRNAEVSAIKLIETCKAELASYKVPASIHFMNELPKGPTGKILRRELRTSANAES